MVNDEILFYLYDKDGLGTVFNCSCEKYYNPIFD